MANIELPKDAEGREIPLDVDALYDKNGERVEVFRWNYVRGKNNNWTFNRLFEFVSVPLHPQDYYLTPPDSWEKLLDDLGMVEDYTDTSALNGPACIYMHYADRSCSTCKLYGGTPCVSKMCADIADRIRKLRGED